MKNPLPSFAHRSRGTAIEWGLPLALALLAYGVVTLFSADEKPDPATNPDAENQWMVRWHAHQMYQRGPDELSKSELLNVKRWCRCVSLLPKSGGGELENLTDEECQFVADALSDLCPNLMEQRANLALYQACRRRNKNGRTEQSRLSSLGLLACPK